MASSQTFEFNSHRYTAFGRSSGEKLLLRIVAFACLPAFSFLGGLFKFIVGFLLISLDLFFLLGSVYLRRSILLFYHSKYSI